MTGLSPTKMRKPSSSLSQQENGIENTLTSIPQMATTTWTEQTKSSWLDWEQDTAGWTLICTVSSRLARRITVFVTQPQWLASTYSKTAHSMMLSGGEHGQRTPLWGTSSLATHRLCRGQQLLFEWQASPCSVQRRRRLAEHSTLGFFSAFFQEWPLLCISVFGPLCHVSLGPPLSLVDCRSIYLSIYPVVWLTVGAPL